MEVAEIDLAAVDSAPEVQGMCTMHESHRIAHIVEILSDSQALAVAAEIETYRLRGIFKAKRPTHDHIRKWIIESRCRNANAGQCEGAIATAGTVGKLCFRWIALPQTSGGTMETQHGLIDQMIVKRICVCQRKITAPIWNGLRKSSQRSCHQAELVSRKRGRLITVHEEEFPREMTFIRVVNIQIGHELILGISAGRTESALASSCILRGRNREATTRELGV